MASALFAPRRRVLMIGGEGVALFGPTVRGVEREAAISWEVPNFDQQLIEALTEQNRNDPVMVLFDGADQTYRKEENIPKLTFIDRGRYIKRKLDQAFPSYPVRASALIKPKDDSPFYLFVALPETDKLDRVSADMLEAGVPIAGFGLLPAESVGLVTALSARLASSTGRQSKWAVLIGQHETGGLRQVVVRNGNLALTRITPTSEAGVHGPAWADEVMREFRATLTYIARFGYTAEEGLDVIVICGNIEKQFFTDKSLPVTNFQCMTTSEALSAIGSRGISLGETNFGDALHAAWVGRKSRLSLPVNVPSLHKIMVPRMAARVASGLLALMLVGFCFLLFSEYNDYSSIKDDIAGRKRQQELLSQEYEQESKVFDALPVKPDLLRSILNVKTMVDNNSVNVAPILNVLRHNFDADMKLSRLTVTHDVGAGLSAKPVSGPAGQMPPLSPDEAKDRGSITIHFKYTLPASIDLEHKVQRAEALVKTLQGAFPGYQVKIASQFGNMSATGKYSGETGRGDAPGAREEEAAEIEMKGPPL